MIEQFRVYDDIHTAIKSCAYRLKINPMSFGNFHHAIFKEEISYKDKLIVVCTEIIRLSK